VDDQWDLCVEESEKLRTFPVTSIAILNSDLNYIKFDQATLNQMGISNISTIERWVQK